MRNANKCSYTRNYLHFLYRDLKAKHPIQGLMSDNTDHIVITATDQQHENVDYADPESPTLGVPQSISTTAGIR